MKNKLGLFQSDIQEITSVLSRFKAVDEAFIFGSRAKGTFHNGSDVDIALKGRNLSFSDISRISDWLNEETQMPYRFDVLDYHHTTKAALKAHVDRNGVLIFERTSSDIQDLSTPADQTKE